MKRTAMITGMMALLVLPMALAGCSGASVEVLDANQEETTASATHHTLA